MFRRKPYALLLLLVGCSAPSHELPRMPDPQPEPTASSNPSDPAKVAENPKPPVTAPASAEAPIPKPPANRLSIDTTVRSSPTVHAMATVTESDLGVPFYPGSSPVQGNDLKTTGPKGTVVNVTRATKDAPGKVIDFYMAKLGQPLAENIQSKEPEAVWKAGRSLVTVSTQLKDGETRILITTSPSR